MRGRVEVRWCGGREEESDLDFSILFYLFNFETWNNDVIFEIFLHFKFIYRSKSNFELLKLEIVVS